MNYMLLTKEQQEFDLIRKKHHILVSTSLMSGRDPLLSLYPGPFPYMRVLKGRKSVPQRGDLPGKHREKTSNMEKYYVSGHL